MNREHLEWTPRPPHKRLKLVVSPRSRTDVRIPDLEVPQRGQGKRIQKEASPPQYCDAERAEVGVRERARGVRRHVMRRDVNGRKGKVLEVRTECEEGEQNRAVDVWAQ